MAGTEEVSAFLQDQLHRRGLDEVTAVEAALWLDIAGVLPDSPSRPGLPLRTLLRDGTIHNAEQRPARPNGRWFIIVHGRTGSPTGRPVHVPSGSSATPPTKARFSGEASSTAGKNVPAQQTLANEPRGFKRSALRQAGFLGFVNFKGIDLSRVPAEPGVYVVLRESSSRPTFHTTSPAGWFKGKDPTVPVESLECAWPEGAHCIYIGKANSLRKRIKLFRGFGDGRPVGHQGGRRIWQLSDSDDFVLAWRPTLDADPEFVEGRLIRAFVTTHGRRPIGNRTSGRGG